MKAFKYVLIAAMSLVLCVALAACMGNAAGNVRPQSTMETSFMPETTTNAPRAQSTQQPEGFNWVTGAGQIEANVSRLSEISDCRVVVTGDTALVGVKFTQAYKGEVTDRIRQMVAEEVMKADPAIKTVAVTAEEDDVTKVYEISDKMQLGEPLEALGEKINEIVRNVTTLR